MRRLSIVVCVGLAVAAVVFASVADSYRAGSTKPLSCWKQVVGEWYAGDVTGAFPHACIEEAESKLPASARAAFTGHEPTLLPCIWALHRYPGSKRNCKSG